MILEILRLKICFVILIPRPAKEQNPSSAGNQNPKSSKELGLKGMGSSCLMMVSLFQAFPSWRGYLCGYPC